MLKKFGKWKESMIKNKYSFGAMVVIAVTALFFCGLAYKVPKVDAVIVADGVVTLSNNYSQSLSGNGNAYHIQGDPNVVYENVTINVGSATTVILEDVYIRQTTDQPVLIFGNGINSSNDYKLVLVGNSVIESTYVDPVTGKGASNPLIHVEDIEYTMTETDNILNAVVTTFTTVNTLVITDVYDGVNYNGSLTLINTPYSEAAVIGTSSTSNMSDTLPPDEPDIDYEFTYCRSGKITVKDEPVLNIVNKGAGAAIGGGGAINLAGMAGTDCGDVEFAGGTVRIILAPVSFGNAVGGGSAVTVSGAAYAPSSGYAGSGADVVITGGSLYIDNQGAGSDFGRGLGKYVSGIVKPGTVTDGDGDTLCVYIADVDADEQSSGGTFTYIDDDVLFGQFDLIQVLGEEEYSYKVSDVLYDGNTLEHINTTVRTTKDTDFLYGGIGYTKTITGVNKSNITDVNIEDISGKLYFYVPATQAKFYNIAVDANSKENLESVTVTKDGKEISSARWETEFKVTIQLEEDYELIEDGVYYVDENGEVCYARQESETEFYFTMPQADIVIYIDSKLPVYTITYMNDLNSTASDPVSFPTTYTVRDTFLFGKPSAPGMTFIRWEDENGNEITGVSGCKGNLQVYATWEEILYTVTFVDYDDTLIYSQATTYGGSVTAPADPVREHYTFIGWDKTFDYVTENIIVKAMYEYTDTKAPYEIKVDEAVVNGTVTADKENAFEDEEIIVTITPDVGYILKEVVVRKDGGDGGMISINKFQAIGGTGTSQNGSYMYSFAMPASDVEISATFEQVEYTITYVNVGNDDHNNPTTYTAADAFVLNAPTKDGFIFDGWTDADGNPVTEVVAGTIGNLVFIGTWSPEVIENDYEITVNRGIKNGTVVSSHETANEGERVVITASADTGYKLKTLKYVLVGDINNPVVLIDSFTYSGTEIGFFMPAEDIIILAEFEAIQYNIVYVDVDNSNNPDTYTVEDEFRFAVPEKEGYVFDKWYDVDANEITGIAKGTTGNRIVIATWTKAEVIPESYTITVDAGIVNGVVSADKDTAYAGDTVVVTIQPGNGYVIDRIECLSNRIAPQNATLYSNTLAADKNGSSEVTGSLIDENSYVFVMPENDIVITAVFKYREYAITYVDGGAHTNPSVYTVADEIVFEAAEKDGFTFEGWVDETGKEITSIKKGSYGDVVVVGKWEEVVQETTEEPTTEEPTTEESTEEEETEPETEEPTTEEPTVEDSEGGVQTGDTNNMHIYIIIGVVAVLAVVGVVLTRDKKDDDESEDEKEETE